METMMKLKNIKKQMIFCPLIIPAVRIENPLTYSCFFPETSLQKASNNCWTSMMNSKNQSLYTIYTRYLHDGSRTRE